MLSRLSRNAARRTSSAKSKGLTIPSGSRRGLVQPSGADRASVVDLPATYKDESHFTPRSGNPSSSLCLNFTESFAARYAWVQVGHAATGGLDEGENSTNIP